MQDVRSNNSSFPKIFLPLYRLTILINWHISSQNSEYISQQPQSPGCPLSGLMNSTFPWPDENILYVICLKVTTVSSTGIFSHKWGEQICDRCLAFSYKWYFEIVTIYQHCFTRVAYICCMYEIKTTKYITFMYNIYFWFIQRLSDGDYFDGSTRSSLICGWKGRTKHWQLDFSTFLQGKNSVQ